MLNPIEKFNRSILHLNRSLHLWPHNPLLNIKATYMHSSKKYIALIRTINNICWIFHIDTRGLGRFPKVSENQSPQNKTLPPVKYMCKMSKSQYNLYRNSTLSPFFLGVLVVMKSIILRDHTHTKAKTTCLNESSSQSASIFNDLLVRQQLLMQQR